MKRKIIKQRDSYTITLPMKWVKEHGIDKGREVEVEAEDNGILISTKASARKEGEVIINSENKTFIIYILNNAYRNGYDKLTIKVPDKKTIAQIEQQMSYYLGWEIVEKSNNMVVIDNLTEPQTERYEALFRQSFYIIKEDLLSLMEERLSIEEVSKHSDQIIRADNFCRRAIVKKAAGSGKQLVQWHFHATITSIHRSIYYLAKNCPKIRMNALKKEMLGQIISAFDLFHQGYFEKDLNKIRDTFDIIHRILDEREKYLKDDPHAAYYLIEMCRLIILSGSPCIGILV